MKHVYVTVTHLYHYIQFTTTQKKANEIKKAFKNLPIRVVIKPLTKEQRQYRAAYKKFLSDVLKHTMTTRIKKRGKTK